MCLPEWRASPTDQRRAGPARRVSRSGSGQPTLLFFHGNAADWQSTEYVTRDLVARGYGVLAAEYRGYGGNPGTPTEAGLYDDGRAAWGWLMQQGVTPGEVVLVGNSIGSGIATQLASETQPLALVLISPFDSLVNTAKRKMRWLPVAPLLRHRYDNIAKLPDISEPVLILHGEMDTLIAVDQASRLAAVRPDTELLVFPAWGHDLVVHPPVQQRIDAFIQELRQAS